MSGIQEWLSFYFKSPMAPTGPVSRARPVHPAHEAEEHAALDEGRRRDTDHPPRPDTSWYYDSNWEFGRATIEPKNALSNAVVARVEELDVEVRPLDSYDWPAVGFIKIDVEGHELAVLAGAERTLAKHHPNLLIECNDEHNPGAPARLAAWLAERGYEVLFFDRERLRPFAEYDRDTHWGKLTIENFIGVHSSRPDQRARLEARVAKVGRPSAS
jgi:FkbM family methyltransferase